MFRELIDEGDEPCLDTMPTLAYSAPLARYILRRVSPLRTRSSTRRERFSHARADSSVCTRAHSLRQTHENTHQRTRARAPITRAKRDALTGSNALRPPAALVRYPVSNRVLRSLAEKNAKKLMANPELVTLGLRIRSLPYSMQHSPSARTACPSPTLPCFPSHLRLWFTPLLVAHRTAQFAPHGTQPQASDAPPRTRHNPPLRDGSLRQLPSDHAQSTPTPRVPQTSRRGTGPTVCAAAHGGAGRRAAAHICAGTASVTAGVPLLGPARPPRRASLRVGARAARPLGDRGAHGARQCGVRGRRSRRLHGGARRGWCAWPRAFERCAPAGGNAEGLIHAVREYWGVWRFLAPASAGVRVPARPGLKG